MDAPSAIAGAVPPVRLLLPAVIITVPRIGEKTSVTAALVRAPPVADTLAAPTLVSAPIAAATVAAEALYAIAAVVCGAESAVGDCVSTVIGNVPPVGVPLVFSVLVPPEILHMI